MQGSIVSQTTDPATLQKLIRFLKSCCHCCCKEDRNFTNINTITISPNKEEVIRNLFQCLIERNLKITDESVASEDIKEMLILYVYPRDRVDDLWQDINERIDRFPGSSSDVPNISLRKREATMRGAYNLLNDYYQSHGETREKLGEIFSNDQIIDTIASLYRELQVRDRIKERGSEREDRRNVVITARSEKLSDDTIRSTREK